MLPTIVLLLKFWLRRTLILQQFYSTNRCLVMQSRVYNDYSKYNKCQAKHLILVKV